MFAEITENRDEIFIFSKEFVTFLMIISSVLIGMGGSILWVG